MRPRKKKTTESQLKESVKNLLAFYRIITWPYPGGVMGTRGFPDRFGILPGGGFLAIEFKANGRHLSPAQEAVKADIEAAGGKYIVCRDPQDVIDGLGLSGRLF